MDDTLFYVFGIALVLSAVGVSALGLRIEGFPPTRIALVGLMAYFAALVGATTTFAVLNARDEQQKREAEQAEAVPTEPAPSGATTTTGPTTTTTTTGGAPQGKATTMKLSAPADGFPAYDTSDLEAKAGPVTIDFDNPSPVDHDVVIAEGDTEIAKSKLVKDGATSVSADLEPGQYTYYCSVPGHRETGMEGTLTVK